MKTLFSRVLNWLAKPPAEPSADAPAYEYPNDEDSTLEEAMAAVWKWYLRLEQQVQIGVQGMGATLEQVDAQQASFKHGVLEWENSAAPDRVEIQSEEAFRQRFLEWARKRVRPYSDTGEFALAVDAFDEKQSI